jgi:UDP-N-acetylmuramate dehydrogenase
MDFDEAVRRLGVQLLRDEPLAKHTTFRIGGPAEWYANAKTVEQLEALTDLALEHSVPMTVLGGGSNLLVSDAGISGLVVANQTRWHGPGAEYRERLQHSALRDEQWVAESGVMLAGLARATVRSGLAGLEWAVSVPGTVAGAIIGNAGAHGSDTAANLAWTLIRYGGGDPQILSREDLQYTYRNSLLKEQMLDPDRKAKPVILAAAGHPTCRAECRKRFS